MAIPWADINPELIALFGELSGGLQTLWLEKQRPYIDPKWQAAVFLRVRSEVGIGVDDRRLEDLGLAAPAPPLQETVNGHRRVGLEVRVESFRHEDDRFAFNAATKIRTRVFFRSSLARLRAQNIALVRVGEALDLGNIVQDDRTVSVANLELTLNVGIREVDDSAANRIQKIEQVEAPQGTLT